MTVADSVRHVADSLRHVIALKDAALQQAATRSLTVNVPPQNINVTPSRDVIDYLVNPGIAIAAAIIGAIIGGRQARKGGLEAIREERRLDRDHALDRLRMRAKSNLRRVQILSEKHAGHDPRVPLDPMVGEELEVVWNLYYRVAEPIFALGANDLSERLDSFFVQTHTVAETVKSLEAWARDITAVGHETEKYRDFAEARTKLPDQRKAVIAQIAKLGEDAGLLLSEVSAAPAAPAAEAPPRS